jgi:hypothetical protein
LSTVDIINWLKSRGINLVSNAIGYIFEVGFRGEYKEATPEILLHEDELARMFQLGRMVGISYHQKDQVLRVIIRRAGVT